MCAVFLNYVAGELLGRTFEDGKPSEFTPQPEHSYYLPAVSSVTSISIFLFFDHADQLFH